MHSHLRSRSRRGKLASRSFPATTAAACSPSGICWTWDGAAGSPTHTGPSIPAASCSPSRSVSSQSPPRDEVAWAAKRRWLSIASPSSRTASEPSSDSWEKSWAGSPGTSSAECWGRQLRDKRQYDRRRGLKEENGLKRSFLSSLKLNERSSWKSFLKAS